MIVTYHLIIAAALLTVTAATYLQAYGRDVPRSFPVALYLMAAGFGIASLEFYPDIVDVAKIAVAFLLLSVAMNIYAITRAYTVPFPPPELIALAKQTGERIRNRLP